jgi:peptide/nickel transport system substrate-binding protein
MAVLAIASCAASPGGGSGASGPPRRGGELVFVLGSEPRGLDPVLLNNNWGLHAAVGSALYGSLITDGDPAGAGSPAALAESLKAGDGGRTWRLVLKEGLAFSDGSPLDAAAVEANWKRHQDERLASPSRPAASMIKAMKAEQRTLEIVLNERAPQFPQSVLNSGLNWIAGPSSVRGSSAPGNSPIGAGPFAVEAWVRGDKIRMGRNDRFHERGRPHLDRLTLRFNPDEAGRLTALQAGQADMIMMNTPTHAKRAADAGLTVARQRLNGGNMVVLNARSAPFNDPRARAAVVKAIDPKALNQAAYEGTAEVPRTFFAKESPFYVPGVEITGYDRQGAQGLFDQLAAEGKPVKFTMISFNTTETKRVFEAIQTQLRTYRNVHVELDVRDSSAALAALADRSYQAMPIGGLAVDDPEPLVFENLHSKSATDRFGLNDPRLDAALMKGREATTPAERKEAYATLARLYAELNPGLLYLRTSFPLAASSKVGGLKDPYKHATVLFAEVWKTG